MIIRKSQDAFMAWFFVIVILLAVTIFVLVLNRTWGEVKPALDEGLTSSMEGKTSDINISETLNQTSGGIGFFDNLLPFLLIGIFGFVMIMAGSIMKSPVMIFVGIIVLGVIVTLSVIYSNVYHSISSSDEFSSTNTQLPIGELIMQYLPLIVFMAGIGIAIGIIYTKGSGGSGAL